MPDEEHDHLTRIDELTARRMHEHRVTQLGMRLGREIGPTYEAIVRAGADPKVQADEGEAESWDALGDERARECWWAGFEEGLVMRQEEEIEAMERTPEPELEPEDDVATSTPETAVDDDPPGSDASEREPEVGTPSAATTSGPGDVGEPEEGRGDPVDPPASFPPAADEDSTPALTILGAALNDDDEEAAELLRAAYTGVLQADDALGADEPTLEELADLVVDAADDPDGEAAARLARVLAAVNAGLAEASADADSGEE